ncbi:polyamine-modulated factor 1-binding protein [Thalictrum thalictroides]|uniref:Polyamine-modulated factor 1-binding protein n=1 Tax=Thalictrum thalictroides TaxID=46969 RepID=A0A7J6X0K9_THATH|nr:polyamine-modulated factor 1-binding protein [Thalictrum thalictroides]
MAEEVDESVELLASRSPSASSQANITGKQEIDQGQSLANLQDKLVEIRSCIHSSENNAKDFEVLRQRVKDTATLLSYLKSKAKLMQIPQLAHTLNGIRHREGVGGGINSTLFTNQSNNTTHSIPDCPRVETHFEANTRHESLDENDGRLIGDILKSIHMINDLLEVLVKMVIMAETEISIEKEKVTLGQEEIKRKALQIESMSVKVVEMERFALSTNSLLNEMQQKVEDMVLETSRQRQRAAENEQELYRVKQDFEALRSYVSSLISVREMLLSSEKHQTNEMQFERLVALAAQLEGEKVKKEAEVQKLMSENVKLASLLDKKEAQLLAMNEQCKVMALNSYGT